MEYLYLVLAACGSAMLSVMSSLFNRKNAGLQSTATLYNLILTVSASLAWGVLWLTDFSFDARVLFYSALYGVSYTLAMTGIFGAVSSGSVSMTGFVKQLSLIAVALWGFVFWQTPLTLFVGVGILLVFAALLLCFRPERGGRGENSPAWFFYAALLLVGNAGCSIIQKYQQTAFGGAHGNAFMFFALLCAAAVCLVFFLKGKRVKIGEVSKISLLCPVMGGVSSAALNFFILLLLASELSESVIFPCIAVGGLILTTLFSVTVCRERLRPIRWAGLAVGAAALVFLNL